MSSRSPTASCAVRSSRPRPGSGSRVPGVTARLAARSTIASRTRGSPSTRTSGATAASASRRRARSRAAASRLLPPELRALLGELVVVEQAGSVQLLKRRVQAGVPEPLRVGREPVRVDAELLQAVALLLDAEPGLRERQRARTEDRPPLHVLPVRGDEPDRDDEREERDHV